MIIDAGIGTASDATIAMEMGCDGVLINSAIANAKKPILMARAFKNAVISGRDSYLAGRMKKNFFATASSPTRWFNLSFFFLLTHNVRKAFNLFFCNFSFFCFL